MKLLVSTKKTQGIRKNDFSFVPTGEIVYFGAGKCDNEPADGHCGCNRSMVGIKCLKATTTMCVSTRTMSQKDLAVKFFQSLCSAYPYSPPVEMRKEAGKQAAHIKLVANSYPVGAILEFRNGRFVRRK